MNSRYSIIALAIVLLVVVAGALVWSQTRQMQKKEEQAVSTQKPTPTPKIGYYGAADQQFEVKILSPANQTVVGSPQLLIRGKTKPSAEVFINDKETIADADGNFATTLTLDEGENLIIVTANDAEGNVAEEELVVTYEVEE